MRIRLALLLSASILLLVPAAGACSLVEEPPAPAQFLLYRPSDGTEYVVPVEGRNLGAGCELSNVFTFDGTRIAWAETRWENGQTRARYYLKTLPGQLRTELGLKAGSTLGLSLAGQYLLQVVDEGGTGKPTLWRHHVSTRTATKVPIELPYATYAFDGPRIAWTEWPNGGTSRLSVYDTSTNTWILRDASPRALKVPGQLSFVAALGGDWVAIDAYVETATYPHQSQFWIHNLKTRAAYNWTAALGTHSGAAIDASSLTWIAYTTNYENRRILRADLPGGAVTDHGLAPHDVGSRLLDRSGRIVFASYAAVETHGHAAATPRVVGSHAPPPGAETDADPGFPVPAPALAWAGLAGILPAALRRPARKA